MVITFLENLQNEYLEEKLNIEKKINDIQIHIKENTEFIKLLEETNDPNYESFTPRKVNSQNKKKIQELKDEIVEIEKDLVIEKKRQEAFHKKTDELSNVIKIVKSNISVIKSDGQKNIEENEEFGINLLSIQENERQRISRELHDSTVQNLTSLIHKAELCSKLIDLDPVRCKLEINMMSKTLREIVNDTRQMIYDLRPMSFDDIGLDVTIERALEKLENSEIKKINFTVEGESYQIKPVIGLTLLRIIQEACSNAIRHANASIIHVNLIYEKNKISVVIEDDGIGFDIEDMNKKSNNSNSGFGLSMMKERAYLLSGNINITSKNNSGTRILVEVPILNKEEKK